jgi:hypothetical protein
MRLATDTAIGNGDATAVGVVGETAVGATAPTEWSRAPHATRNAASKQVARSR